MTVNDRAVYDHVDFAIRWHRKKIAEINNGDTVEKLMLDYHQHKLDAYEDVMKAIERNRGYEINWINKELGNEVIKVENNE